jgi:hypothetical protein
MSNVDRKLDLLTATAALSTSDVKHGLASLRRALHGEELGTPLETVEGTSDSESEPASGIDSQNPTGKKGSEEVCGSVDTDVFESLLRFSVEIDAVGKTQDDHEDRIKDLKKVVDGLKNIDLELKGYVSDQIGLLANRMNSEISALSERMNKQDNRLEAIMDVIKKASTGSEKKSKSSHEWQVQPPQIGLDTVSVAGTAEEGVSKNVSPVVALSVKNKKSEPIKKTPTESNIARTTVPSKDSATGGGAKTARDILREKLRDGQAKRRNV